MKNILVAGVIILMWGKSFSQTTLIPIDKIAPVKLFSTKIKDTSGDFIKGTFPLNLRIWEVGFTKIEYEKKNKFLQVWGTAGMSKKDLNSFKIKDFEIHLGALHNDTLVNVKHLTKDEFLDSSGNFEVRFDLKKYTILIFSCPGYVLRIYDFTSLLLNENGIEPDKM